MLILSRRRNEDVIITTPSGEKVLVRIIDIRGDKVRIGFHADERIEIMRRELLEETR